MFLVELKTPYLIFSDIFSAESLRKWCFLCTLPGASRTMDNIEVIRLLLDHNPEQYFSSYFSLLHEVCYDQHEHTQQLGETFF